MEVYPVPISKTYFPRVNALRHELIQRLMVEGLLTVNPNGAITYKLRPVNPRPIGNGYLRVKFYLGNYVDFDELHHRFMYMALTGPIPDKLTIDHIDKNRANNSISNLRVMTLADNSRHSGEDNGGAKLNENEVEVIRGMYSTGRFSQQKIADAFSVSQMQVSNIVSYRSWK